MKTQRGVSETTEQRSDTNCANTKRSEDGSSMPADGGDAIPVLRRKGGGIFTYVTDELGNILAVEDLDAWNLSINLEISGAYCQPALGRNIFEFISDEKVARFTRHIIYMLATAQHDQFQYLTPHHVFSSSCSNCYTQGKEGKFLMNVSAHQAFDQSKLIVWACRVLTAPTFIINQDLSIECIPSRCACTYCQRIMISCIDLEPNLAETLMRKCDILPSSILYTNLVAHILSNQDSENIPSPVSATTASEEDTDSSGRSPNIAPCNMRIHAQISVQGVVNHLWLTVPEYHRHQPYLITPIKNIHIIPSICEICYAEIGAIFFKKGTFHGGGRVVDELRIRCEKARLYALERAVEMEVKGIKMATGTASGGWKRKSRLG